MIFKNIFHCAWKFTNFVNCAYTTNNKIIAILDNEKL